MAEPVTLYAKKDGAAVVVSTPSRVAELLASGDYQTVKVEVVPEAVKPPVEPVAEDEAAEATQEQMVQEQAKTTKPKAKRPSTRARKT